MGEQLYCTICKAPLLDKDQFGIFAEIRRAKFQMDEEANEIPEETSVKFNRFICEPCYLNDPDLCRFMNKIGCRVR